MDKNLISKIIKGEASVKEKEEYYKFLTENKDEEELFYQTQSLWVKTHPKNQLSNEFISTEYDAFLKRVNSVKQKQQKNRFIQLFKYAAILTLVILMSGIAGYVGNNILNKSKDFSEAHVQKFSAAKGSIAKIELSDGTKVNLNSGSELTFLQSANGERKVKLTGEGYFEVEHLSDKPFFVEVGDILVKDLGTVFNIKAYQEDKTIETTLLEGKAEILKSTGQTIVVLSPGEQAEYSKLEKSMGVSKTNLELVLGWQEGKFVFRDKRLEDICMELQNWYDVKFVISNQALKDFKYSGTIKRTTTVAYVLKMLKFTTNIDFKITNKPIGPDLIVIN